jgi:hypothetical protein
MYTYIIISGIMSVGMEISLSHMIHSEKIYIGMYIYIFMIYI